MNVLERIYSQWGLSAAILHYVTVYNSSDKVSAYQEVAYVGNIELLENAIDAMTDETDIASLMSVFVAHNRPMGRMELMEWMTEIAFCILMDSEPATRGYLEMAIALDEPRLMCLSKEVEFPDRMTCEIAEVFEKNGSWYECLTASVYHPELRPHLIDKLQGTDPDDYIVKHAMDMLEQFTDCYKEEAVSTWAYVEMIGNNRLGYAAEGLVPLP